VVAAVVATPHFDSSVLVFSLGGSYGRLTKHLLQTHSCVCCRRVCRMCEAQQTLPSGGTDEYASSLSNLAARARS
jgi:hypothetical protein